MSDAKNNTLIKGDDIKELSWDIIKLYFKGHHLSRLVSHQLNSYNHFVDQQLLKTINMFNPVEICSENDKNQDNGLYSLKIICTFSNFKIHRPSIHENNGATKIMYPSEARYRNFTYSGSMTVDLNLKIIVRTGEDLSNKQVLYKKMRDIRIGKLPIMLKSGICVLTQFNHLNTAITGECKYDPGGYFIINGSEKTVLGQERAAENTVNCFNLKKNNTKWSWMAELKSVPDFKCISPKQINVMISRKNNGHGNPIYIQIPRIKNPIPIFILFRALGVISDKDICAKILLDVNHEKNKKMKFGLKASIFDSNGCLTKEDAINYITTQAMYTPINMTKEQGIYKKKEFTLNVINNDLFPHCQTKTQKIYFMGTMVHKLLKTSYGWRKKDDRDSYINKRIDLVGTLLNNLFRNYFNKLVKDMTKQVIREINNGSWKSTNNYTNIINHTNIYKIVKSTTIENGLKRALSTGDFGIKNVNSNKVGVAQVLNRLTYISTISHLRRINTPIDKSGKLIPPRKLHSTQFGLICPCESPEGGSVGVVKNLSYMAIVTIKSSSNVLYDVICPKIKKLEDVENDEELFGKVKVIINGNWIGYSDDPMELYQYIKTKKYTGIINIYTGVVFDYKNKEIIICNDAGRLMRPIYKVSKNNILMYSNIVEKLKDKRNKLLWLDLFTDNVFPESLLEYVDSREQNACMISMDYKRLKTGKLFTHCEINPSTILGILASCIPFPQHNQSPRNTYQCAMGKQAMGMYVSNFDKRMDKTAYVQTYTTRPLVDTRVMNFIKINQIPSGNNVIVAIMCYSGFNVEDSVLINRGAIERGLFSATIYHTEKDEEKKIHGDEEIRCKADKNKTKGIKFGNYDKLNKNGLIPENTKLENNDILMGKVIPIKENRNDHTKLVKYKDASIIYRTKESCYVDKNYINRNGDGYTFGKVRTRSYRIPNIGDKFSSRHGQKGTVGLILNPEDMPTTSGGLVPDIIINPHAIPSRMTIAQLKETLLGKALVELGMFGDGTSFGDLSIEEICNELQKLDYERHGNEILYNGMTGEQLETDIYIGPAFYQRLKHMTMDKVHSRARGPMVILTRQAQEGRARDGGLRYGEMERDCMIAHGCSAFNQDRIYYCSDTFSVYSCMECGLIAVYNNDKGIHFCKNCNNRRNFNRVNIPYANKLLFQELMTMNIVPRIITDKMLQKTLVDKK